MKIKQFFKDNWLVILLLVIITYFSFSIRMKNRVDDRLSGMDPWWYLRFTREILNNGWKVPEWNYESHYPPGRTTIDMWTGWPYSLAIWYRINQSFSDATLVNVVHYAPAYFSILLSLSAFLVGQEISNKWGGLLASVFVLCSPMILTRTMAGFSDNDVLVFSLSLLCIYTTIRLLKKQTILNYVLAILTHFVFSQSWSQPYWTYFLFMGTFPLIFLINIKRMSLKENMIQIIRNLAIPLAIVGIIVSLLTLPLNKNHVVYSLLYGMSFLKPEFLLVNVSIAELIPINILSADGFIEVASRVGIPFYISMIGLPVSLYFFKKKGIGTDKLFILVWFFATLYLITTGNRYMLLFSLANAVFASFVIVSSFTILKEKSHSAFYTSIYIGSILFFCLLLMDSANGVAESQKYSGLSQNWIDAMNYMQEHTDYQDKKIMLATYWDFGHVMTNWGFYVLFDGAQATKRLAYPYDHSERIQDMGTILTTDDEDLAIALIKKYNGLDTEKCEEAREHYRKEFGVEMPDDACDPLDEIYFLSSGDLIGKYQWLSYFGGQSHDMETIDNRYIVPGQCYVRARDVYVYCPWPMGISKQTENALVYNYGDLTFTLVQTENTTIPLFMNEYIITEMVYGNQKLDLSDYETSLPKINGMLWLDPSLRQVIYFHEKVKDSIFIRTFFFNGQGLEKFKLFYSNPEIKIFKIDLS